LFGTENEGFCGLIEVVIFWHSRATAIKNDKIRVRNAKFVGKRNSLNEFIAYICAKKVEDGKGDNYYTHL
jgi:hypothetical protein